MPGPDFADNRFAAPLDSARIPPEVEALLAEHGLTLALDRRAQGDSPVLHLVDSSTGMPVRRLPAGVAQAISRLADTARLRFVSPR
jgi:hypothetical protein